MQTIDTPWTRHPLLLLAGFGWCLIPALVSAQTTAASSAGDAWITLTMTDADGNQVIYDAMPGAYIDVIAPPESSAEDSVSSNSGSFLETGPAHVLAASAVPVKAVSLARSTVDDLQLSIGDLVGIVAEHVEVEAEVNGPCGHELAAAGTTSTLEASTTGSLIPEISIQANPPPNTEVVNQNGVRIVVNEQILTGDGFGGLRLSVSGVHVYLDHVELEGGGTVSGGAILGYVDVELECLRSTLGEQSTEGSAGPG